MGHTPEKVLIKKLKDASKKVKVGDKYMHNKKPDSEHTYTIVSLVLDENSERVMVNYRPNYLKENIIWARFIEVFLEEVKYSNGKSGPRFIKCKKRKVLKNKK